MNLKRVAYISCISSATAVLASSVALAQQMPAGQQQTTMPGQPQQQQTSPTVGSPGAYPENAPNAGEDLSDKAFVSKAMEGSNTEVELAQLAEEKSQSPDVKQLAQKLALDHSQMNDKWFKPVAQQLGISKPNGPSKKEKKTVAKLQNLSGSDFDTQYLTMMLKNHQQDLKQYQDQAKLAQDPNVKQVAERGAGIIEQHLQMIEQVARNHNIGTPQSPKPSM
jgi:putative membrane protein